METRNCDECKHFNDEDVPGARVCEKNHKPRWYAPKNDNPYDLDYGYKRKCGDYEKPAKVGAGRTMVQGDLLLPVNVEFSGAAPLHGAASAGTKG